MTAGKSAYPLIFDGHNDTVISLAGEGFDGPGGRSFYERSDKGHIDLVRAREGGLGGGFLAMMARPKAAVAPTASSSGSVDISAVGRGYSPESGWPPPMPLDEAQSDALIRFGKLFELERDSNGKCKIVRSAAELQHCLDNGIFAIELHFEGADPLDPDGRALEVFYAAGLRSVGITHFRQNIYAAGVPNIFPATLDIGDGLT